MKQQGAIIPTSGRSFGALERAFLKQLRDILTVAYPTTAQQYLHFSVKLSEEYRHTKAAEYKPAKPGQGAEIWAYNIRYEAWHNVMIALIWGLAHHVDYIQRNVVKNDPTFYCIWGNLLDTCRRMRILSDRSLDASANWMWSFKDFRRYMPEKRTKGVSYRSQLQHIRVYSGYQLREELKQMGFYWNGVDQAWVGFIPPKELEEVQALLQQKCTPENVLYLHSPAVMTRLRKAALVSSQQPLDVELMKRLGYYSLTTGIEKKAPAPFAWGKLLPIGAKRLSEEEYGKLKATAEVRIKIH